MLDESEYLSILNVNYLPACILSSSNGCDALLHRIIPIVALAPNTCPVKLADLTNVLVRDLPSYTNRLIQQRRSRKDRVYSSIVTASMPELKSIETISREYPPHFPQTAPTQVFISTLERQYTGIESTQLQQFHWLFLAQTHMGWRLVNIYSRISSFPLNNTAITPPIESSNTVVGEAIGIWLNDCYQGKVRG
jgi:hypothetical protein